MDAVPSDWLAQFHAGTRTVLDQCYRDHFDTVWRAVGSQLHGVDQETVVHEVFFRVLFGEAQRRKFEGGSFAGWIYAVARNHARDYLRRIRRERPLEEAPERLTLPVSDDELDWLRFVERFRRDHLPVKWWAVFDARFVQQLSQREAANTLNMHRTTLVYQELQVRRLLEAVLLDGKNSNE
jgi:RNA polymerase sigma-70 factor (ECF subfamily)